MTVLDTENQHLSLALERAGQFLAQGPQQRAASDWLRHLREDRDSRTFFNGNALRRSPMFAMKVAEEVAKAYLGCSDVREGQIAPTGTQVRALQATASALESELVAAGAWLIADATGPAFREPLCQLQAMPSRVPPRTAGRLPVGKRRMFVLHLAESLYALGAEFPTKFLMVAAILAWEETSDRTIRLILTQEVRDAIAARAAATRAAGVASENATHRLLSRVRVKPVPAGAGTPDNRPDVDKLADALRLLESFTDRTAATVMVAALSQLADEFGIGLPADD
ncbi:hypothetical protein [Paraburkholderia nemoris]|uniref:hypothetical protein n=1 Tax=Paraburkholderia nemoris TaxID=2793076 RepID=UPI0038B95B58